MTAQPPKNTSHLHASDLRAIALLVNDATQAVSTMGEGVHRSVWRTLGVPSGATSEQTRGLTGLIYKSIHGVTHLVGRGVASVLTRPADAMRRLMRLNFLSVSGVPVSRRPLATHRAARGHPW